MKTSTFEMNWEEAKEALAVAKAVVVPVGSTEQHGPHLPLQVDTVSALSVAQAAAIKLHPDVLVSTPIPLGVSFHHMKFAGSITLRETTLMDVVYDVCWSLKQHGVSRVLLLNGHLGNFNTLVIASRKAADELGQDVLAINYWDLYPSNKRSAVEDGQIPGHASEFETSIMMFATPDLVRKDFRRTERYELTPTSFFSG